MNNKRWILIVSSVLFLIAVFFIGSQWEKLNPSAEFLTKEEASTIIEDRYKGKVSEISLSNGQFTIEMVKNERDYLISMDEKTGEVLSLDNITKVNKTIDEKTIKDTLVESGREIISLEKKLEEGKEIFVAEVKEENGEVLIKLDAGSGKVLSEKAIDKSVEEEAPKILSEAEAIEIALEAVKGTVDDDIEFERIGGHGYYLIEIETDDDREAVVQVHAITGVVKISWED
ncbi:PepSY domain-containing protein [Cytobacillus purgationiresistens]|uniref:Membrane protein YkoI n=1 Tax=Cytobacillus purgationiresistens TaxID=863449 RepID=A0ABU0AHX8_9BACI|nr:PepSY domain-containing protein [Cytobacillus purgationiresistens]MDQ0270853.1 putative membrane protein YkoI [Cytobacillus purgationiresistens]